MSSPPKKTDQPSRLNYEAERDQALDWSRCFLCGTQLDAENRTDEHVFPKWMLKRFNLWDEVLNLINGTGIKYRQVTIPCCSECNNVWLAQIEAQVADAVDSGRESVEKLDTQFLAIWMSKIFYGLLFRNLTLVRDRKQPESGPMVPPELLKEFSELHQLLQVTRDKVVIPSGESPASIFIFDTLDSEIPEARFDYVDMTVPPFLSIRLGGIGIVACLLDWGIVSSAEHPHLRPTETLSLHPMQFREVSAYLSSEQSRLNRTAIYLIGASESGPDQVVVMPKMGMSAKPPVDDFDPERYAQLWARVSGFSVEQIWNEDTGQMWSTLMSGGAPYQAPDMEATGFKPPEFRRD